MATEFSEATFKTDVLESDKPVLVDFWAPWCGPCKMLAPVIDKLAGELGDQITVGKVNVDDNPNLAQEYGIMSIPTMLIFKDGEIAGKAMGFQPEPKLKEFITSNI